MRNNIFLVWIIFLFISFSSVCKPKILSTTTIIHDIVKNIGKDSIQAICLLPLGSDPHIYEPTPADAQKVAEADLIIKNGLYLEGWLEKLLKNSQNTPIYTATTGIEPYIDNNHFNSPDPHAWMSPVNAKIYAQNISFAITEQYPNLKNYIENNLDNYIKKLDSLHIFIIKRTRELPIEQRIIVTSHNSFKYFGIEYGYQTESILGNSTDADVQIADINNLNSVIQKYKINAIFVETTINPKLLNQIAKDNGIVLGGSLYSDSVGDETTPASTYIDMMYYNVNTIVDALLMKRDKTNTETKQMRIMIISVIFLFLWSFVWLVIKLKNYKKIDLDWSKYQIVISNISVSYEKKTVISNINFTLDSGYIYGLLGPNGAGKSTLFKTILGLISPDTGSVLINYHPIEKIRHKIAYIPQKEEIDFSFPATVLDIVQSGRLVHKNIFQKYNIKDRMKAYRALKKLGLEDYRHSPISDLSGGQQQRVFIARALCQEAEVLFFDEPFVGVDVVSEERIMQIIRQLAKEKKTIIMIHHDLSKVKDYFDKIIVINKTLIAYGNTKDIFNNDLINKAYSGRATLLEETDKFVFDNN